MTLRLKLVLSFLFLSVIPLLVVTIYSYVASQRAFRRVFLQTRRQQDEIPFAVDSEGKIYTADPSDQTRLEELPLRNVIGASGPASHLESEQMARGNLAVEVPIARRDELGRLALTFNRMARELKENQQHLVEAENQRGEEFGCDRLEVILVGECGEGLDHLMASVEKAVRSFRGPTEARDDPTIVALKLRSA